MWENPQFPADMVTLLKKSLMENFIFCAVQKLSESKYEKESLLYVSINTEWLSVGV